MLQIVLRILRVLIVWVLVVGIGWFGLQYAQRYPQNLPWADVNLREPIGSVTGRKLTGLSENFAACQQVLRQAQVKFQALPAQGQDACFTNSLVQMQSPAGITYSPTGLAPTCAVAAALVLWETQIVQTAARKYLQQDVKTIRHFGTYSCRRVNGSASGRWSEHATGNAVDIAGFVLSNGKTLSVLNDWHSDDAEAQFLHEVRDGACRLFATVLSPDYNSAHADHLHFDQAERGTVGWRMCR